MKYKGNFTLEIKMSEFYLYAIPKCSKAEIKKHLRNELYQAWHGIVDGEWGGSACNWKRLLYQQLYQNGYIEQTELSKELYGEFKTD